MKLCEYSKKVKRFRQNEKEIDKLRQEYHKRCFELFDSVSGDREKLAQIAEEEQVSIGTIRKYAWEYATYVLGYSTKEWDEKYLKKIVPKPIVKQKQPMNQTKTNLCLLEIKNEESKEKIINIIEEYGNVELLKEYISNFVIVNFPEEKESLIQDLKRKINFYISKQKQILKVVEEEQKKKLEKEQEMQEIEVYNNNKQIMDLFIEGNYESKCDFCNLISKNINEFEQIVEYSKKYDKDTYNKYEKIIEEQRSKRFNKILTLTKLLVYYIENGIEDEYGIVRPFDIIDYHLYIGINYGLLRKIVHDKGLKKEELKTLRIFFENNKNCFYSRPTEIKQLLAPTSIKIISGIRIEQETKELIIKFLEENNIPGNNKTYNIALRKYLNNTLKIQETINAKTKTLREIK